MRIELGKAYALDQVRLMTNLLEQKNIKDVLKKYNHDKTYKEFVHACYKDTVSSLTKPAKLSMNENNNFDKFTASIPTSSKLMNSYIKELKKDGFTAVFDDNAKTSGAFILFDTSQVTQTGSKDISKKFN